MVLGLDKRIRRYRAELDQVLRTGSIEQLKAFQLKHGLPLQSCDEAAEITLHKTITASTSLPLAYRQRSKTWLNERGYTAWDEGDL